jgi:hypothetical protein
MLSLNRTSVATAICAAVVITTTPAQAIRDRKSPSVSPPSSIDQLESTDKTGPAGKGESNDAAQPAYRGQSAGKAERSRHLRYRCGARYDANGCDAGCAPRRYRSRCGGSYVSSCGCDGNSCGDYVSGCDDYAYAPDYSVDWVEAPYYGVVWGYAPTYDAGWDLGVVPAPAEGLIAAPIVAEPSPWGW